MRATQVESQDLIIFKLSEGCVRTQFSGMRQLALVEVKKVGDYLKSKDKTAQATEIIQFMNNSGEAEWQDFLKVSGNKVYVDTCGPNDVLYVPCGYLTAHKVFGGVGAGRNSADVIGLRVATYSASDLKTAEGLLADRTKHGKTNNIMAEMIRHLETQAPVQESPALLEACPGQNSDQIADHTARATAGSREEDGEEWTAGEEDGERAAAAAQAEGPQQKQQQQQQLEQQQQQGAAAAAEVEASRSSFSRRWASARAAAAASGAGAAAAAAAGGGAKAAAAEPLEQKQQQQQQEQQQQLEQREEQMPSASEHINDNLDGVDMPPAGSGQQDVNIDKPGDGSSAGSNGPVGPGDKAEESTATAMAVDDGIVPEPKIEGVATDETAAPGLAASETAKRTSEEALAGGPGGPATKQAKTGAPMLKATPKGGPRRSVPPESVRRQ